MKTTNLPDASVYVHKKDGKYMFFVYFTKIKHSKSQSNISDLDSLLRRIGMILNQDFICASELIKDNGIPTKMEKPSEVKVVNAPEAPLSARELERVKSFVLDIEARWFDQSELAGVLK